MDEQLHIIVAGDRGKVFKLPFSRKKTLYHHNNIDRCSSHSHHHQHLLSFPVYEKPQDFRPAGRPAGKTAGSTELIAKQNRMTAEQTV